MVQNILQGELPRCLLLWWDFCSRVWFEKFSSEIHFSYFFFHFRQFDDFHFQYCQVLVNFLLSKLSDAFGCSIPSFVSLFSFWHIFPCQIPFVYPSCMFLMFVSDIIIITPSEFFTLALVNSLSLKSEW